MADPFPGATQPRVTERPKPPELLGATFTVDPASPVTGRVGRPVNRHRTVTLGSVSARPRTTMSVTYGPGDLLSRPSDPAFRPSRPAAPGSFRSFGFPTRVMVNDPPTRVKSAARNPYVINHISSAVPNFCRDVHRYSPEEAKGDSLSERCAGVGARGRSAAPMSCLLRGRYPETGDRVARPRRPWEPPTPARSSPRPLRRWDRCRPRSSRFPAGPGRTRRRPNRSLLHCHAP